MGMGTEKKGLLPAQGTLRKSLGPQILYVLTCKLG